MIANSTCGLQPAARRHPLLFWGVHCHLVTLPPLPPLSEVEQAYYAGQDLISVVEASQVAVIQIQRRPVVQTECKLDHDEASAKGLDCCIAVTFSTTPQDM